MNAPPRGKEFVGIDYKKQKKGCKPYSGKQNRKEEGGSDNCRFVFIVRRTYRRRNSTSKGMEKDDPLVNTAPTQGMQNTESGTRRKEEQSKKQNGIQLPRSRLGQSRLNSEKT
jgi:hypothetical protein